MASHPHAPPRRPQFVVGIDLGTTNSAVAYVELADSDRRVLPFPVEQLVAEGSVAERPALPSFLYVGGAHEIAPGALALPWDAGRAYAVGEFARLQGARVPGRLISSAKSWLCHGGVDREASILPWAAAADVTKMSPVEASARYLQHLCEAWARRFPAAPLEEQDVVLTVPASFDEVARELTVDAARIAGLAQVVLLEEPQAAFYAWLQRNESEWERRLEGLRLILVVDVGGGTTDFSLVRVGSDAGGVALERLAVGDHLLLGGDNVDVALARMLEPRLGAKLDSQRWQALTGLCRAAKETLLADDAPAEVPVRLAGRGQAVVGGTLSAALSREEVSRLVLDGFFPLVATDARPRRGTRAGLQEFGLPFAEDPEVSRHLAAFLALHRGDAGAGETLDGALPSAPDAILFNGGALKPPLIRARLTELLAAWNGGTTPALLESVDLDLAVARGAAYYGLARRGRGVRIGGGAPRAYYVGVAASGPAPAPADSEGGPAAVRALCLTPRGMHEGEEIELADPPMEVVANRGVSFPLYASSTRRGDRAGDLVTATREELSELPPIRTVLRFGKKLTERKLPVHLVTRLTEVGTLEVWCRSLTTDHRWRLQFQLRDRGGSPASDDAGAEPEAEAVVSEERLAAAVEALRAVFPAGSERGSGDPVSLSRRLEEALDCGKDDWPLAAIRKLWDVLWEGAGGRAAGPDHEARWLNLAGFLLRPGFGADLDDFRVQQLWKLRSAGLRFPKAAQCRVEWWNLWKRIAAGLTRQQQLQVHAELAPALLPRLKAKGKGPRVGAQELREFWQLAAGCERLSAEMKAELGEALLPAIVKGKATEVEIWALGRLGARAPVHGPLNCVVGREKAARWVEQILQCEWPRPAVMVFLVSQLARCVGDRERDLDEGLRRRVAERVGPLSGGRRAAQLVTEFVPLEAREQARLLDESLPVGLRLRGDVSE